MESLRGRPALQSGEKGNYNHVLLNSRQMRRMDIFRKNPIVREEDKLQVIRNILGVEETANYYWKVVYTTAFQELKAKTKDSKYSLRNAATDANVPYHNMKKLFSGKGNNEISYRFMLFFYLNGIDIQEIRLRKEIISEAYNNYLNYLRNKLD